MELYFIDALPSEWIANEEGKKRVSESSVEINIRISSDAKRISASRNIEKARLDGTVIKTEGPIQGGNFRVVERNVDDVAEQLVTAYGVTLPVKMIAALVAQAIDDFAKEDREKAKSAQPSPMP